MTKLDNNIDNLINAIENTSVSDVIFKDSQKYVPVDTGRLKGSGSYDDKNMSWDCDYAKWVYYIPDNEHLPPTSDHWVDKAESIHRQEWAQELKNRILSKIKGI